MLSDKAVPPVRMTACPPYSLQLRRRFSRRRRMIRRFKRFRADSYANRPLSRAQSALPGRFWASFLQTAFPKSGCGCWRSNRSLSLWMAASADSVEKLLLHRPWKNFSRYGMRRALTVGKSKKAWSAV